MKIRTFWTIFIKIIGIWLVMGSATVIPQFFSTLFFSDPFNTSQSFVLTVFYLLLTIGIYLFILRLFVFKTAWLIDKLHLDKGFTEEKIDINVKTSTVLTIAIIVMGGLMFLEGLPLLCKSIFVFFQQQSFFNESPASEWIVFNLIQTTIGFLLMTNSQKVLAFINKQASKQNDNNSNNKTDSE